MKVSVQRLHAQEMHAQKMHAQTGSALPYVLGLIVCMGLTLSVLFQTVLGNNRLAGHNAKRIQCELLAESGLQYALAKIGSKDSLTAGIHYQTTGLQQWLQPPKHGFQIQVLSEGLYSHIVSRGLWVTRDTTFDKIIQADVGQVLSLNEFPALALTNQQGSLVLAGNASIKGDVLLWQGQVSKKNFGKIKFVGKPGHSGRLLDSNSGLWDKIPIDLKRVNEWIESQESLIHSGSLSQDPYVINRPWVALRSGTEVVLEDTLLSDCVLSFSQQIVLGRGVEISNCKLVSRHIVIQENARVEASILYAQKKLSVSGTPILKGQFLARDSMTLRSTNPSESFSFFYVHGHLLRLSKTDSLYTGHLSLQQFKGQGVFLFGGWEKPHNHSQEHISIQPGVDLTGLVYAKGWVNMSGKLNGSLVCENLRFKNDETIYTGHLYNSSIEFYSGSSRAIPVPLVFKEAQPLLQNREYL